MPEVPVPEIQGTPDQSIQTLQAAYEAAKAETPPEPEAPGAADAANAPEEPETAPPEPARDPEHIDWAKRVSGNWDAEKGEWNLDLLVKRAYELNRQNQLQAQSIAKIEQLLQKPEVLSALNAVSGTQPAKPKEEPGAPKTDEQILADFINQEVEKRLGDRLKRLEEDTVFASQRQAASEMVRVRDVLNAEFGKEGDQPLFQAVLPQILSSIETVARENNTPPERMVDSLIKTGKFESTLRSMTKALLFDRVQAELAKQRSAGVTAKKGLAAVPKGSSQAKPPVAAPNSIAEAMKLAREQLATNKG